MLARDKHSSLLCSSRSEEEEQNFYGIDVLILCCSNWVSSFALIANTRLGLKCLPWTNTLAYFAAAAVKAKKVLWDWCSNSWALQLSELFFALLTNNRLGLKCFLGKNTLAYFAPVAMKRKNKSIWNWHYFSWTLKLSKLTNNRLGIKCLLKTNALTYCSAGAVKTKNKSFMALML